MNELVNHCKREKSNLRNERNDGNREIRIDRHMIVRMMEDRLMIIKEAIENGLKEGSTAPSGITGSDAIKMQEYINQGKALTGPYVMDVMTFSLAASELMLVWELLSQLQLQEQRESYLECWFALQKNVVFPIKSWLEFYLQQVHSEMFVLSGSRQKNLGVRTLDKAEAS